MRFPVVKGPLGCKRLRQGDVLPDIAEVSEVRARHARTSLRSRYGFPPLPGSSAFAWASVISLGQRHRNLHLLDAARTGEVDLPRRAGCFAAVLLDPTVDGVVRAEDLRDPALLAADLGEGDLAGRQALVALGLRHTDLDGTVLLVVDRPVVEDEARVLRAVLAQLAERVDDELLELGHEQVLRPADIRLLVNPLREDVVHGLLLQDPLDVAEHPPPFGELVRDCTLVPLEAVGRGIAEER